LKPRGLLFVEQGVELVKSAEDSMGAVGLIMAAFGVKADVAKAFVSYLLHGVPPAATFRGILLSGALAVGSSSDDKDASSPTRSRIRSRR
jgi:hypothetical protein